MRILSITAGAGPMYCGSCLRDNALAAELMARGHDITLLPVYTPTRTDEPNVSEPLVLFGGISVYLEQHLPLFRRTPAVVDRLWDNAAVIRAFAGRGVSVDPGALGEMTVSMLKGEQGFQRKELAKLARWLQQHQPPFDVIVLPNALLLGLAPTIARVTGRPIVCTLQGEDLFLAGLDDAAREESMALIRRHAGVVSRFVAVSRYYADFMASFLGLPRERIDVVPLGVGIGDGAPAPPADARLFTVGYLARIAPEKGLDRLAEAYRVARRERGLGEARLATAGYRAPEHEGYLDGIRARLAEAGLSAEFSYAGTVDRRQKAAFLRAIDVFSMPAPYHEPKGLSVLEAMGAGVPVVLPRHGAFVEMVEATGGGVLVPPDDPGALADALVGLSRDGEKRRALGAAAAAGVRRHYSTARMAERAVEVYAAAAGQA